MRMHIKEGVACVCVCAHTVANAIECPGEGMVREGGDRSAERGRRIHELVPTGRELDADMDEGRK